MSRVLVPAAWSLVLGLLPACMGTPEAPRGRVVGLLTPEDPEAARRAGCFSAGARAGAGFSAWAKSAGGLQGLVDENEGAIELVWIAEAWAFDGRPGTAFSLRFLRGERLESGAFRIPPSAYNDGDAKNGSPNQFEDLAVGEDHWLEGSAARFSTPPVAILGQPGLWLRLLSPTFAGEIYSDEEQGLSAAGAILSGYISQTWLRSEIARFLDLCGTGGTSLLCQHVREALSEAPSVDALESELLRLAGGYDAGLEGDTPSACTDGPCNALSVCVALDIAPVELTPY